MIFEKLNDVRARIDAAARRSGRDGSAVDLVAVTKKVPADSIIELLRTGLVQYIGESRIQDALRKAEFLERHPELPKTPWRMIGHLQTNKAASAVELFDSIDSLDSLRLAKSLNDSLVRLGRKMPVLIQVKLTQRESQSGIDPNEIGEFLKECRNYPFIEVQGLMAIAPMLDPVETVRPYFKKMKQLFDRWPFRYLSMGMSRDFEIAIEEGANMVRLGSVLFS